MVMILVPVEHIFVIYRQLVSKTKFKNRIQHEVFLATATYFTIHPLPQPACPFITSQCLFKNQEHQMQEWE